MQEIVHQPNEWPLTQNLSSSKDDDTVFIVGLGKSPFLWAPFSKPNDCY